MCIRDSTYNWINTIEYGKSEQIGFIAQKVQKVHECLVHEGNQGLLRVDYDKTTALLTTAVAELSSQILQLKQEIASLKEESK